MARLDLHSPWQHDCLDPLPLPLPAPAPAPALEPAVKGSPVSATVRRLLRQGSLPALVSLEAVVRLGSFSRAAEELSLAQSTVSGHILKLSDTLGSPVFARTAPRLELSRVGGVVHGAAQEILAALQRAETKLHPDSSSHPHGREGARIAAQTPPSP